MITIKNNLQTEVVGSEDGKHTYEVKRSWGEGRKALMIELYPVVSTKKSGYWDLSAMHLMNHANELGWGEMQIINLYSTVFSCKPTVKELKSDVAKLDARMTIPRWKAFMEHLKRNLSISIVFHLMKN